MINEKLISEIAHHEEEFWNNVFNKELSLIKLSNDKGFSSFWWELYFNEITSYVRNLLKDHQSPKILEAGSGSGKASILLGDAFDRTLLDISPSALRFAKHLIKKSNVSNVTTQVGDVFNLPFEDHVFDFTWNIGVIEHYPDEYVREIFMEMIRVTKEKGKISIGVPNFNSLPILKAKILKIPLLKFIPGYRLGSELPYKEEEIINIFCTAAKDLDRHLKNIDVMYFGNPLFIETPKFVLYFLGKFLEKIFYKNKFLIFVTFEFAPTNK